MDSSVWLVSCPVAWQLQDSALCEALESLPHYHGNLTQVESSQPTSCFLWLCALSLAPELVLHSCDRYTILFLSFRVLIVTRLSGNSVLANSAVRLCSCQNLHAWLSDPKFFPRAGAHSVLLHFTKVLPAQVHVFLWFIGACPIIVCCIFLVLSTDPAPSFVSTSSLGLKCFLSISPPCCWWLKI